MLRFSCMTVIAGGLTAFAAAAQNFTTAAEVKPILTAIKPSWIAVREYDGQDLLYFTNLLAWRCGVASVSFAINGGVSTSLEMEPCHDDTGQPNALLMKTVQPYIAQPLSSIETVSVTVTFDDATTETGEFDRKAVMTP